MMSECIIVFSFELEVVFLQLPRRIFRQLNSGQTRIVLKSQQNPSREMTANVNLIHQSIPVQLNVIFVYRV